MFVHNVATAYALLIGIVLGLLAIEYLFPRGQKPTLMSRLTSLSFILISVPLGELCTEAVWSLGVKPLLAPQSLGETVLYAVAAILLFDFLYYWLHRAQHRFEPLWRIHAVHHSIRGMGAGSGYHHVLEQPLQAIAITLPMAFLVAMPGGYVGVLLYLHGNYVHALTSINLGLLSYVIADNRTHRIHHSLEERHFGTNYGVLTMVWDRVFGTAYQPAQDEWPEVGLDGHSEPRTIGQYLSL